MRRLEKVVSMAENELKQLKDNLKLTHEICPRESSISKTDGPREGSVINNIVETFVDSIPLDLSCTSSDDYLKTISERTETDINSESMVFNINLVPCNPFSGLCNPKVYNVAPNGRQYNNPRIILENQSSKQMSEGISSIVTLNDQSTGPFSSILDSEATVPVKCQLNNLGAHSLDSPPQSVVSSPPQSSAPLKSTFQAKTNSFVSRQSKKTNNTKPANPNVKCNYIKCPLYTGYLCKGVYNSDLGLQEMPVLTSDYSIPPGKDNLESNQANTGYGSQPPMFPIYHTNNLYAYAHQQSIPNVVKQAMTKKGKLEISNSCNHMQFICNNQNSPAHVEVFITKTPENDVVADNNRISTSNKGKYARKTPAKLCHCGVKSKITSFQNTTPIQRPEAVIYPKSSRLPAKCRCICTKKKEPQKTLINKPIQTSLDPKMNQPIQSTTHSTSTDIIDRRKLILAKCAVQTLPGVIIESTNVISSKQNPSPKYELDYKAEERRRLEECTKGSCSGKRSTSSIQYKSPERHHVVETKLITDIPSNRKYSTKHDHNDDIYVLLDKREMISSTCATNATESISFCQNCDADPIIAREREAGVYRRRCKSCGCIKDVTATIAYKKAEVANRVEKKECVPHVTCTSCADLCEKRNCKPNKTCDVCESIPKVCCGKSKCCRKDKSSTPKFKPIQRGEEAHIVLKKVDDDAFYRVPSEKVEHIAQKREKAEHLSFSYPIEKSEPPKEKKKDKSANRNNDESRPCSSCCSSRKTSKKCTCPHCDLRKPIKPCKGNCRHKVDKFCSECRQVATYGYAPETPERSRCCACCRKKNKFRMCDNHNCTGFLCNDVEHTSTRMVPKQSTPSLSRHNTWENTGKQEVLVYKMEDVEPKLFDREFLAKQTANTKVTHCTSETLGLTGDALSESTIMDGSILNSSDKYVIVHDASVQAEVVETDDFNMSFSSYMGCGSPKRTASLDEFLNLLDSPHMKYNQDLGMPFEEEYRKMVSPRQYTNACTSPIIAPTKDKEEEKVKEVELTEVMTISPIKPKKCGFLAKKNDIVSKSKHFDWKIMRRKKLKSPKDDSRTDTVPKSINQRSLYEEITSSEGETNCTCSVSIGEVHECKRLLGTKVDQKNGKIVKMRPEVLPGKPRYNKNVVSYYISTSSSVNDSMK